MSISRAHRAEREMVIMNSNIHFLLMKMSISKSTHVTTVENIRLQEHDEM